MNEITIQDRKWAREMALQLLFQREFSEALSRQTWPELFEKHLPSDVLSLVHDLLTGIEIEQKAVDQSIQAVARNWKLERMSYVDRNVLRIGTYEMLYKPEPTPAPVIINECVELAKKYGSTDSGGFVNGILDQLSKSKNWSRIDS